MTAFLRDCARRLDCGEDGDAVMADMRTRFTTAGCLKVKTCLVRKLCSVSSAYTTALSETHAGLLGDYGLECAFRFLTMVENGGRRSNQDGEEDEATDAAVAAALAFRSLPSRLPDNAKKLCITNAERKACKTLATLGRLKKNKTRVCIRGMDMLKCALADLVSPTTDEYDLALSLLFVTGRRTCELLNGSSKFVEREETHTTNFTGQAKRVSQKNEAYAIPLLVPFLTVQTALQRLRTLQGGVTRTNKETSLKYQSVLGRALLRRADTLSSVGHVHALRGAYACMALRMFKWPQCLSSSFVVMNILGHTGLEDSLVYTTVYMDDEEDVPRRAFDPSPIDY